MRETIEADRAPALKVLIWDVETSPLLSYHFRVWSEDIRPDQLTNKTLLLSWAAKWEGEKKVHSGRLTSTEAKAEDDSRIVEELADLIRQADVVVAHNGDRFDIPVLNTRLLDLRLPSLPPVKQVDTLKIAKRTFKATYNRLDYLARFLGHEPKQSMQMADWIACTKGDEKALRKMDRYCRHDVTILENVWLDLKPYAKGLPRLVTGTREMQRACPACGSEDVQASGMHHTNASTFPRFQCRGCGRYSRGRSSTRNNKLGLVPL